MTKKDDAAAFQNWISAFDKNYHPHAQGWVGPGWIPILEECFKSLRNAGWHGQILQIKEKLGALRVYVSGTNAEISEIINRSEEKSRLVCEECGSPGSLKKSDSGWLQTRCERH